MKMSPIKSKIPSGKVTHVIDPSNIWIQLCTREFQELDADIQESYENVYPSTQPGMVQAEQFVIAYSNLAKKWLRACVSRVMDTDVDLFYLDYGYAEQRPVKQISTEFEPRFSELPAQALPCRLYGIEPLAPPVWISRASKILNNITSGKMFFVLFNSISAGKHVVTLYDMKTQQNIIHQLLQAEVCKLDGEIPFSDSIHFDCNPDSWDFQPGSMAWPYAVMDNGLLSRPSAEEHIQQPAAPIQSHTSPSNELVNPKKVPLRVPSTDMSIFEVTSDLTPEKLVAFSQQQEYHRAQQEVSQIFAEHSAAANDHLLHSPEIPVSPGGFSTMKTMDEVLSNVHNQLQEMYNADKHPGNGNNSSRTTPHQQADTRKSPSSNKQSTRNQGMWIGKKRTVPPGFRPLGCSTSSEFSAEDGPRNNYNSSNIAGKLPEDCSPPQAQILDNRLLRPLNSVPVLATPSMFDTSDNQVSYQQEVENPGCHPSHPPAGYSSISSPPHNSALSSFKRKLYQILPNNSNIDWSHLSWQFNNLFHNFDGRMLQAEKLELVFEYVLQQAILNPSFLSTAISLVFLFKDKDLFKESLVAVVKHLENTYVKVDSKDAEFCAVLMAHILVEIAKQDICCSICLSPFQNIIFKWLKSNSMTCASHQEKLWQMMYQECFVSFWSLAGGDCLLLMPQDFKEFLREEIHLMILKSDVAWSLRSRLLSVNTLQEQIVFFQERNKSCDVATQTDVEKASPIPGNNSGCETPLPVAMATVSGGSSVGSHEHICEANDDNMVEVPDRWSPVSSPAPPSPGASAAENHFSNSASPLPITIAASQDTSSLYTSSSFSLPQTSEPPTDVCDEQPPPPSVPSVEDNERPQQQSPELISPSHFISSLPSTSPPENTEALPEFLWSKSINDFELKKPIVEPMSWNPFEPDFLERTLETAHVALAKVTEEERPVSPPSIIPTPQPVQPIMTTPEMVRGSYAARVAEKACENQNAGSHRNNSMFDYRCEKLNSVRSVLSSRDNGNSKIRFVAKRLVPDPNSGNLGGRGRGRKNAAFSNSSSSNSSCTSSPSSKIWNQPRQGPVVVNNNNNPHIQGTGAALSLDQIGKMLQNSNPLEKDSWTAEKAVAPVAPTLTDNNHNDNMSTETGDDRNRLFSRNRTHMEIKQCSSNGPAPIATTCRQEAPTINCTICGLDDHETHQCPDHSKSFFI